jgi:hypothetical protein
MRLAVAALSGGALLGACSPSPQTTTLRSLEAGGRVSFLCLATRIQASDGTRFVAGARDLGECPDFAPLDGEERHLFSLVTQTRRGEIAVVDLTGGGVVDEEPTVPGFNFLPVGAQPTSIVSTPGSVASFVGVAEVGREGIFAIPWSAIGQRQAHQPIRDLTSWSACRLPSAPGDIAVLVDEPYDGDHDPSTVDAPSCGAGDEAASTEIQKKRDWPADLSTETGRPGRRKLVVSLPDRGEVVILDAQTLLDQKPGVFEPCQVERRVPLAVNLPEEPISQQLPPDLAGGPPPTGLIHGPFPNPPAARPAGFAQVDDPVTQEHRLFVADHDAPVVHVLGTAHPCEMKEEPPLLPVSFVDPARVVTTSRVAASPLTTDQKRYLYAIDEGLGGGAVMMFDISPGASDRTPLLRPRSALLPFEPPDRIAFDAPARDVAFALRDHVEPDSTGSQRVGVLCDPKPDTSPTPGSLYRPSVDHTTGAGPGNLRGIFGFIALESGQVSVIDVQDFDAPCRRPTSANTSTTEDFRGCSSDPTDVPTYQNRDGTPTVSAEVSCSIVEANRSRSALFILNDDSMGIRAPSLRSMPKLVSDSGRTLLTDNSDEGVKNPRMLAVNFSAKDHAQVYVGTTLFETTSAEHPLRTDPATADQASLVLSFAEPRAYAAQEDFAAVYEGSLLGERSGAQFALAADGSGASLTDSGVVFCDHGVEDRRVTRVRASKLGITAEDSISKFASRHADYAVIKSDLLDETDSWWRGVEGSRCGGADPNQAGAGFLTCQANLGTHDAPSELRELRILEASANTLRVEPRLQNASAANRARVSELLACCFPQSVSYEVRASAEWVVRGALSGFRHDIMTDATGQCAIDDSPLRAHLRSRALEMSCSDGCPDSARKEWVGRPASGEVACIFDSANPPPQTIGAAGSECLYQGLTTRFALYAGKSPTVRDSLFSWTVTGGYSPLIMNLASLNDASTAPQSMVYSPQQDGLVVVDGATKGLVVLSLATLGVAGQYF